MSTIPAIYGLRKELGLDDDTARDLYHREVGVRSLRDMTPGQQVRVMQALQRQVRTARSAPKGLVGPYAGKLQALWISGWNLGIVRDRTDAALLSFVERQSGISHTRFLRDAKDARKAIEGLKSWLAREALIEWSDHADPIDAVLGAQGQLLGFPDRDPDAAASVEEAGWWAWRNAETDAADRLALTQALGAVIRKRPANGKRPS